MRELLTQLFIWIDALHPVAFGLFFLAFCISLVFAGIILAGLWRQAFPSKKQMPSFIDTGESDQWEYR